MQQETGPAEAVEIAAPAPTIDIEAVRTEASRQGYAQAGEIVELCALAGLPGRAAALLARHATPSEARRHLLEVRAAEDSVEIRSHVMPETGTAAANSPENNPVVQAVERLMTTAKGGR